jgi:competence protein ComFC
MRLECIGCGKTMPGGITCEHCRPHYDVNRIFVVSDYHDPVVSASIKALKYKFLPEIAGPLVQLASAYIQNQSALHRISFAGEDFVVIPVPLHWRRENWRGFNQAGLIARDLANRYRLKYSENLVRTAHLTPQANIKDKGQRFENIMKAYICPSPETVLGKNILLIDDVCTTGATLNECARVLKNAGAASVSALVIARG